MNGKRLLLGAVVLTAIGLLYRVTTSSVENPTVQDDAVEPRG